MHPQDLERFKRCRVDLGQPGLQEAYRQVRQIYSWLGQIGPIPLPTFIELAREYGPWEAPKASQEAPAKSEPVHKQNGKPKPVVQGR